MEAAKSENKPLLVSIGYSACHWCHVMAHESFEDSYIAGLMNDHFINVKVDREERPDVDQVYMEAVQMISQHGGWPLHVFCLPDGRPFFGGTYFPPIDRGQGIIPWPQLLLRVADHFQNHRQELEENADSIVKNMTHANQAIAEDGADLGWQPVLLIQAAISICETHDDTFGGFGGAPKFPPAMALDFLLAIRSTQASEQANGLDRRIDSVVPKTLISMATGGLYDQIGHGFARYSVDERWEIPHFEKMLYDNGLLISVYLKAYQRYRLPLFRQIVEETINWLNREMRSPDGPFFASQDADSEGVEGKYYVWTPDQVREALAAFPEDQVSTFLDIHAITDKGNFEDGLSHPQFDPDRLEHRETYTDLRHALYKVRRERVRPGTDRKHPVGWNSLVISALAEAGFYWNRTDWFDHARQAADWIWARSQDKPFELTSVYYEQGIAKSEGFLTDYAYHLEALLALASKADWREVGLGDHYLKRAIQVAGRMIEKFKDPHMAGYYFSSETADTPAARKKDWFDNAVPAGNSSILHGFSQLYAITGDPKYRQEVATLQPAYPVYAARIPSGVSYGLSALTQDVMGMATIKVKGPANLDALQDALSQKRWRKTFIQFATNADQPEGYQLCVGTQCLEPVADPMQLLELI